MVEVEPWLVGWLGCCFVRGLTPFYSRHWLDMHWRVVTVLDVWNNWLPVTRTVETANDDRLFILPTACVKNWNEHLPHLGLPFFYSLYSCLVCTQILRFLLEWTKGLLLHIHNPDFVGLGYIIVVVIGCNTLLFCRNPCPLYNCCALWYLLVFYTLVAKLRNRSLYKTHEHVQKYVENVWMSCVEGWAKAFWKQQVLNTKNGVEAQNKYFKYNYLLRSVDKSVFDIAALLVEWFIPDAYQHYLNTNFKLSSRYRKFKDNIRSYLQNRPAHFIKHCMSSKFRAEGFRDSDVDCVDIARGEF